MDGALEVCHALADHCRLYIITNGIASVQHGRLDPSSIRPYFHELFISDELGAEKPDKAFFERVAQRIPDFDPADTLVVGDSLSSDIRGGICAGLDTCWLNPNGAQAPCDVEMTYTIKRLEDVVPLVLGA
jgi:2-haloacid dehalogenase